MRIGELAALVGVSTRTVRHYHHLGVLPEPERRANGYRDYRLRDAVNLARIRRLAELGLSLEGIREVLAADRGRDLREVLAELDADLARQQEAIEAKRNRLAALLTEADLHPDSTVSPEMAAVLGGLPVGESAFARLDRELLALVDTTVGPEGRAWMTELIRPFSEPEARARTQELYARLDGLADADPRDPRVAVLADDLARHMPEEMAALMAAGHQASTGDMATGGTAGGRPGETDDGEAGRLLEALCAEMSPAQVEVLRVLMTKAVGRG